LKPVEVRTAPLGADIRNHVSCLLYLLLRRKRVIKMAPQAAGRQQLPDEVASYVRELIFSGRVRPGEFLRMEPIAEAVGVSITPVREGLLTLRSEGFVQLAPRRGFVVASFAKQDVRDIFWAQAQLAGELAARAAKAITPQEIEALERNLDEFRAAVEDANTEALVDLGERFHIIINRAADSHRLALLLQSVVSQLPSMFYATIEGKVAGSMEEHPLILDALKRRKGAVARKIMISHVEDSADHLIEMLEARGLWDESRSA
jgi:DNA-binding GntR family transcriptional regulator